MIDTENPRAAFAAMLAHGRLLEARHGLMDWAYRAHRVEPDDDESATVSLAYALAVRDLFDAAHAAGWTLTEYTKETLLTAVDRVLRRYEGDGLPAAAPAGLRATWLEALRAWAGFWPRLLALRQRDADRALSRRRNRPPAARHQIVA